MAEFKIALNSYLKDLVVSPVRSLADIIAFNNKFADLVSKSYNNLGSLHLLQPWLIIFGWLVQEKIKEFGQKIFLAAEATDGIGNRESAALLNLARLSRDGFEKLLRDYKLDALVSPGPDVAPVLAIGGFPGINVPAGYDKKGVPFGITFGGLKGSEPNLIEIAYSFEQATKVRKPPTFQPF